MPNAKIKRKLRTYLLKRTRQYVEIVAPIMVGYFQKKLSIPVVGSGISAVRSVAGEYPRTETGSLKSSIDYRIENRSGRIVLVFGSLKNSKINGKKTNPTLYARYLAGRFNRRMARSAWNDAMRSGALRSALNRRRVPFRSSIIERVSMRPYRGG